MTRPRRLDLRDDEDPRVVTAANAFRQARQGKPYDEWEWAPCTQDDVDRARELIEGLDAMAVYWRVGPAATTSEPVS